MNITVSGIPIDVRKKRIKNLHLYVKPPEGNVVISAPHTMPDNAVEAFARTNLGWIKAQIKKFEQQPRLDKRQYVSGETLYIWGKQYFLEFRESRNKNSFEIRGNTAILSMRSESTVKQREEYVRAWYRAALKDEIAVRLPKWERNMGLYCDSWHVRYMTTRWGTCNTDKKRILFNVQLAQKPTECLDYIIIHELAHLRVRNHGREFEDILSRYMKNWRDVQSELNGLKLDYVEFEG